MLKQPDIERFYNKWSKQLKREGFHNPSKCRDKACGVGETDVCFCVRCEPLLGRKFSDLTPDEREGFEHRILGDWEVPVL